LLLILTFSTRIKWVLFLGVAMAKESKNTVVFQEKNQGEKNLLQAGHDVEIKLSDLFLSPDNVRTTERTRIPQLAANIKKHGLLQRLQVSREVVDGEVTGRAAVEAGGRRLLALQHLADDNKIAHEALVSCRIVDKGEAVSVSLAENIDQESMHPSDEFEAFNRLKQQGATFEEIASNFGQTVVQVKRRLKMAAVAAKLFKLYREDKMTLDQLMVLASVEDQQRQLAAWKQCGHWNNPGALKKHLLEDEIRSDDPRVKLVGLDAYKSNGGAVREDLFASEGGFYLENPELVWMMLGELLDSTAAEVRTEGWSWVETRETLDYSERHNYQTLPTHSRQPTKQEAKEIERLTKANDAAYRAWDTADSDDANYDAVEKAMDDAATALEAVRNSLIESADEDKSYAGAIVHIEGGQIAILRGLVRSEDFKRFKKDRPPAGEGVHEGATEAALQKVPERLMLDLTSHVTAAMQVAMIDNHKVALAALAATVARKVFNLYSDTVLKVSVSLNRGDMEKNSPSINASPAVHRLDAERQGWIDRMPDDEHAWFAWFIEQPEEVVLQMLAYAAAVSVQSINRSIANEGKEAELAAALDLNMSQWWQATPLTYLELVPKAKIIEAITEAKGEITANKMLKMKKSEAVIFAAQCLEGTNWLPPILRRA
jgi:ParB family transcriptional regulator, chromosome partitioning protein